MRKLNGKFDADLFVLSGDSYYGLPVYVNGDEEYAYAADDDAVYNALHDLVEEAFFAESAGSFLASYDGNTRDSFDIPGLPEEGYAFRID